MKALRIALLVALPLVASVGTIAEPALAATTCDAISCTGIIKNVSVFKTGHSYGATVRLDTDVAPTGSNCTLSGGSWLVDPDNSDVIRTLTAAHLAGKSVTLREVTNTGTCKVDYVTIW
jgi:hypothetical protein